MNSKDQVTQCTGLLQIGLAELSRLHGQMLDAPCGPSRMDILMGAIELTEALQAAVTSALAPPAEMYQRPHDWQEIAA